MSTPRLVTVPFVLVTVAVFLGALSPNLFVLASRYLAERDYSPRVIGIVMSSFMVGSLTTMPLVGRIIQRGRRATVVVVGCLVGGLGCFLFERASGVPGFVAGRLVQGCGFACVLVSGSAYVAEIAPPERLAQALGFAGILTLASQAAGPAFGEFIVGATGWQWLFWSGAIAGVIGAGIGAFLSPVPDGGSDEPEEQDGRVGARAAIAAMGLAGFGFGAVLGFIAAYAQDAGIGDVAPFFWAYASVAVGARVGLGHLADRHGRRATAVPALIGQSSALALLSVVAAPWQMIGIGALYGLAHGMYYPSLQAQIVERAPANARSRAVAASTLSFGIGVFTAILGLGFVADAFGYPSIYLIAAGAGSAAAVGVWLDRS